MKSFEVLSSEQAMGLSSHAARTLNMASWSRRLGMAAGLAACMLLPQLASATAIVFTENAVFRADRTANPFGFSPTSFNVIATVRSADGSTPLSGSTFSVSTTRTDGTPVSYTSPLNFFTSISERAIFQVPYADDFTNPWIFNATNGANTATATRQAFLPIAAMPFVENVNFTGTGNNLTVNWTVTAEGASRLNAQQVSIWDVTGGVNAFKGIFNLNDVSLRSLSISSLGLTLGRQYALEIQNVEINDVTHRTDVFSGFWLTGWTPTEGAVNLTVPEPATLGLLMAGLLGIAVSRKRARGVASIRRGS